MPIKNQKRIMPRYTKKFKEKAVSWLNLLKEQGSIELSGEEITNVKELITFLGVSSYSLYKWRNLSNNTRIYYYCSECGSKSWLEYDLKTHILSSKDLICDKCLFKE